MLHESVGARAHPFEDYLRIVTQIAAKTRAKIVCFILNFREHRTRAPNQGGSITSTAVHCLIPQLFGARFSYSITCSDFRCMCDNLQVPFRRVI
jgi:hypothetical protein